MADPLNELSSGQDHSNIDSTSISNIPISDFRRNEVRPILTDDGNLFFYGKLIFLLFQLDRHKSIYHQPSLTKYNPTERRRKHRRRSHAAGDVVDTTFKSLTSSETNDSYEIGKSLFPIYQ